MITKSADLIEKKLEYRPVWEPFHTRHRVCLAGVNSYHPWLSHTVDTGAGRLPVSIEALVGGCKWATPVVIQPENKACGRRSEYLFLNLCYSGRTKPREKPQKWQLYCLSPNPPRLQLPSLPTIVGRLSFLPQRVVFYPAAIEDGIWKKHPELLIHLPVLNPGKAVVSI